VAEQDIINARKEHLKWLKENAVELYPLVSGKSENIAEIKERFEKAGESFDASVSGRVTAVRLMGKAAFAEIFSNGNKIQLYIKRDEIPDDFNVFKKTDIGDFANVSGFVFKTKMGETTIHTKKFTFLCKSARPLPEKWHGLRDEEQLLRKRYLDILTNERSRNNFKARSRVISGIRKFLDDRKFMEVETPILHGIAGGAEAEPFKTHHNALDLDLNLRIAPELYLKRLLVAGYDRVYELGRNFRNEGISTRHNPEFTMLELYQAYSNCQGMMDLCEELIKDAALRAFPGEEPALVTDKPFRRIAVFEALKEKTGINFEGNSEKKRAVIRNSSIGFIFQQPSFLPEFTALENVLMPALIGASDCKAARGRAEEFFEGVGMSARCNHFPSQLSGGELQRLTILRALINEPEIILCDEPTGQLDEDNAALVMKTLREVARDGSSSVVFVTHNQVLTKDAETVINLRGGRIEN